MSGFCCLVESGAMRKHMSSVRMQERLRCWIPFLGFVGQIWSLILLIIGTQEVHGISRTKAILMYVLPLAVLFVLALFAIVFFLLPFGSIAPFINNGGLFQ